MMSRVKKISGSILTMLAVAALWVSLYRLNMWGYKANHMPFISWVFVPSGFKLFVSLILRINAIPGLILGSLYLNHPYHPELAVHDRVILSLISSVTGLIACLIMEGVLKKKLLSYVLSVQEFVSLSLIYALSNSVIHMIFFNLHHDLISVRLLEPVKMFVGDFFGVAIFMSIINRMHYLYKKYRYNIR